MLVGDLNTGRHLMDEAGSSFFCADAFETLTSGGWVDAWRRQHGDDAREFSWYSTAGNGFRIDHCLVSPGLVDRVGDVRYLHGVREEKVSDHSMLVVEVLA